MIAVRLLLLLGLLGAPPAAKAQPAKKMPIAEPPSEEESHHPEPS
jgi:hypothetical protein